MTTSTTAASNNTTSRKTGNITRGEKRKSPVNAEYSHSSFARKVAEIGLLD